MPPTKKIRFLPNLPLPTEDLNLAYLKGSSFITREVCNGRVIRNSHHLSIVRIAVWPANPDPYVH